MTQGTHTVESLLAEMTLLEKIGQMAQVSNDSISPGQVADHAIGSVLSGGNGNPTPNTPAVWADMVGSFVDASADTRLGIPLVYGVDAVHGHASVRGATVFPHNIGLGAAGSPDLVERTGRATAAEMQATGVRWTFGPTVAVPQDIRWGRTYEGFGRDPALVSKLAAASVKGLQGHAGGPPSVLACAKHFVGDGATAWGTAPRLDFVDWWDGWGDAWQMDQGDSRISEQALRSVHLAPYRAAVDAGVMTVMASYSSWNGVKLHAHGYLLTDVLKGELGFEGFVVSDWMGVDQIAPGYEDSLVTAINAGVDMVMIPIDYPRFIDAMKSIVSDGRIPVGRIDAAVRRILTAKHRAGLFDEEWDQPPLDVLGSEEHRSLAGEAVRRSAVLLKNDGALPLSSSPAWLEVAGSAADDIGLQCGGWTVGWQGAAGPVTEGTTLLEGLRSAFPEARFHPEGRFPEEARSGVGIVCIGERPYAEGPGDCAVPEPTRHDRAIFARMRARSEKLILIVYSGRPLLMPDLVAQADAVIAAWLPGSEGAALVDLVVGAHRFEGRSPQPWPQAPSDFDDDRARPLFGVGHGLDNRIPVPPTHLESEERS